ncbi:MAG TPA: acyltransferase family protein, partial [Desulfitobacteriaceae bacterium]|nr:acyltransferase family protein [Desulfitobacteriaceae bacterium]
MALKNMEPERLYYLDWLRVLVILSLIPFHASLTYLRYGTVYIKEPAAGLAALPFLIVEVPLGDFFMTLLFFVSGMASFYSFKNRGSAGYTGERLNKLMLPFLLGFLFLCPWTGYLQALYEGYQGNFFSFIPQFFWYQSFHYHGYGHLWFLLYLFVFSMLCVPLFKQWQRNEGRMERIGAFLVQGNRLLLPIGVIVLLELCLRPFFHPDAYIIIFDWANDAVYLSLFIYGYVF